MAWNGSGGFTLLYSWVARRDAGSPTNLIGATEMDAEFANIKTGLENCVTRDGQNAATAALPMGGYAHTGVGAATARTQYARVTEAQDGTLWKAASPGGTIDAMTGTLAPTITAYAANMIVTIVAPGSGSNTVTGPTINLNSIGVKTIKKHQGALVAGDYTAGDLLVLVYDGAAFELLNPKYSPVEAIPAHSTFTTDSTGGALDDLIPFIDTSDSSADNKVAVSDFFKNVYANVTAKAAPIAADSLTFADSAASGAVKRATFTELFTSLLGLFTAKSAPILADTVMIADSAASGAPKISTLQQILNNFTNLTAKTSLADADQIPMVDSAASSVAKKITWANFKTNIFQGMQASQSEMEGGSGNTFASSANMKWHPGVAKATGSFSFSGSTQTNQNTHGLTSATDNGVGQISHTFSTAFATGYYIATGLCQRVSSNDGLWPSIRHSAVHTPSTTNIITTTVSAGDATSDPFLSQFAFFGDQ